MIFEVLGNLVDRAVFAFHLRADCGNGTFFGLLGVAGNFSVRKRPGACLPDFFDDAGIIGPDTGDRIDANGMAHDFRSGHLTECAGCCFTEFLDEAGPGEDAFVLGELANAVRLRDVAGHGFSWKITARWFAGQRQAMR